MNASDITFEILNAYVDGELNPAETADVARAVADDPRLADQVAALSRLRSAVADGVETPAMALPAPADTGRRSAIAAGIAFLLFIAGSVLVSGLDRDYRAGWLQYAWQMHRGWSVDKTADETPNGPLPARYADTVSGAYVPDLTAARLAIVHAATRKFPGNRDALLIGYRGSRGCKISLIAIPRPKDLGETMYYYLDHRNEAYAWRVGALGYVILSDGMDPGRFKLLAESVRLTSRQHLPFDQRTRLALRESRDTSQPCLA